MSSQSGHVDTVACLLEWGAVVCYTEAHYAKLCRKKSLSVHCGGACVLRLLDLRTARFLHCFLFVFALHGICAVRSRLLGLELTV